MDATSSWMTDSPDSFSPEMEEEAADWMLATGFRYLPVVENGEVSWCRSTRTFLGDLGRNDGVMELTTDAEALDFLEHDGRSSRCHR